MLAHCLVENPQQSWNHIGNKQIILRIFVLNVTNDLVDERRIIGHNDLNQNPHTDSVCTHLKIIIYRLRIGLDNTCCNGDECKK